MQKPQPDPITLNDILITEKLAQRSPRSPNWQAEAQAMQSLAHQMAQDSERVMQTLVEIALELCNAGSAGVSLPETTTDGEEVFRWNVLAGTLAQYVGGTTPRNFSPCGVCLDHGTPVLFSHPEQYFTYFQSANTPVVEGLVLPLIANDHALGTIWIMSHDEQQHFDSEDVRVMTSLADFTATALILKERQTRELLATNVSLEAEIVEHKQTEEQLGEAQRRLELSLTGANLGIWTYNVGTDEFWADDRAKQMHGHEAHEVHTFEEAGANIHPEDNDLAQAAFAQVIQDHSKLQIEYRVIWRDGSIHWIASYAEFVTKGDLEGTFYGVVQDISEQQAALRERKKVEIALRESEEHLQRTTEAAKVGTWQWNLKTNEVVWSLLMKKMLGYEPVPGQNTHEDWIAILNEKDLHQMEAGLPDWIQGVKEVNFEYRITTPQTKETRWIQSFGRVESDAQGEPHIMQGIAIDITERKRAEKQLHDAAEMDAFRVKLGDVLRSLADPLVVQEVACRVLGEHIGANRVLYSEMFEDLGSQTLIRVSDYTAGVPSRVGWHRLDDYGKFVTETLRAGRNLLWSSLDDLPNLSADERSAYEAVEIEAIIGVPLVKKGQFKAFLAVHQATPRKWMADEIALVEETAERTWAAVERARAEEALRQSELERVREQSAREQERQRAETLAELDHAKTTFFSNVSHELRTPLTLLLSPLQDALSDRVNPLSSSQQERLEIAHRNGLRLLKLVNTLLDFSRIEAGRMEAVYEPTDLALFTTELASVFRSAIERAGLELIVDCPRLPEPVYVDREMWEKIVLNLLSNAFKFTLAGKIKVSLHPADSNNVTLQVRDTGTGISSEELPRLFERFYQVRGTQARTYEGSGIGLALVYELIRLHNGTIEVNSTVGQGTCFTVSIPMGTEHLPSERIQVVRTQRSTVSSAGSYVEEAEGWLPADSDPPQPCFLRGENAVKVPLKKGDLGGFQGLKTVPIPSSAHILIVDDNADMRDYLMRILSEGFQVETFADGASALAAIQERSPDLVLTDVMMPGLDGFELLKALRTNPQTRELPIIMLSARAGEESVIEGLDAGADDYLIKPFSAQELISRVNAHLQMAQLRGEALRQERNINRRKDQLLSTVSHELNTPLVAILGWTRLLRSSPPSQLMLMKSLDTIERNATLQARLIQDLLDISRITAGKLRLNQEPVELKSVIEMAIATVSQTAVAKSINLIWQGMTSNSSDTLQKIDSVVVMGDRDRLHQVFSNLLTNAIKFTPEGGRITVSLSLPESIEAETQRRKKTLDYDAQVTITDTGIGISPESLPHIFDYLYQEDHSSSSKGLGLGLAIAQNLVELHNGTIHAESLGLGQGTTFTVRLPIY